MSGDTTVTCDQLIFFSVTLVIKSSQSISEGVNICLQLNSNAMILNKTSCEKSFLLLLDN